MPLVVGRSVGHPGLVRRGWRVLGLLGGGLALVVMAAALRTPSAPSAPDVRSEAATPAVDRPAALFVGDSYTAGAGASSSAGAWSCLAAVELDWICNRDAEGGTGFINDGRANQPDFAPLPDRLAATASRFLADVVVVDSGRNDMSTPATEVVSAIADYVASVRQYWPDATLVLVVPSFLSQDAGPADPWHSTVAAGMQSLVVQYGGLLIDPVAEQWTSGTDGQQLLDADGVHPNDAGHALLAERFVADVRTAGLADPSLSDPRR